MWKLLRRQWVDKVQIVDRAWHIGPGLCQLLERQFAMWNQHAGRRIRALDTQRTCGDIVLDIHRVELLALGMTGNRLEAQQQFDVGVSNELHSFSKSPASYDGEFSHRDHRE